jgi:hypothetical protein
MSDQSCAKKSNIKYLGMERVYSKCQVNLKLKVLSSLCSKYHE